MVGVAALVELLLSSVTFAVGLIVFAVLVPLSCLVPCWLAWRGRLIAVREAGEAESRSAPTLGAMAQLRQMAQVVAMPFVGLMVFAFMMGARKFVLFDVVHMEVLGCVLGAVVVLPICLMRTRVPLMPLIYRVLVPLFALLLIFLNCFPASTGPMWFAAWMSYAFYGAVAILALAGLVAAAHASEFSPGLIFGTTVAGFSGCSLLGVIAAQTVLFQIEGGGPALLVVSTLYFVYLLASASWPHGSAIGAISLLKRAPMLPRLRPCAMWPPAARSWPTPAASPRARARSWGIWAAVTASPLWLMRS